MGLAIVQYQYLRIGLSLARVQFGEHIAQAGEDIKNGLYSKSQLTYLLEGALEKDSTRFNTGLEHMTLASRYYLEDFLREKLIDNRIDADFRFSLMSRDSSFYLSSSAADRSAVSELTYPLELQGYLPTQLGEKVILQLQFTHLTGYFLQQLNGLTLPSILFLTGILVAVFWVLRTFYWQQRVLTTTHEFINNLTHELRTPVFSISLAAKILRERVAYNEKELTENILQQTGRISNHIDKVLDLGALERAKSVIILEQTDFRPNLLKVCQQFEQLCALEGIPFHCKLNPGSFSLQVSEFHMENVINNLLDNARKYGQGSEIILEAARNGKFLEIVVRDSGPGIPESELDKIFTKYYRISKGNRQDVRGYGLGLSYVKTVMERHKGRIFVTSDEKRGTSFTLKLPLAHYDNAIV
jgi:two-component system phosphate regulon sensor histidine kinase PhoR